MDELIINNEVYREVNADFYSEADFEARVKEHLPKRKIDFDLNNDLWCCEMKTLIKSQPGDTRPDLIVFDTLLTTFWIVEVELSKHSWSSHVYDQMKKLREETIQAKLKKYTKRF